MRRSMCSASTRRGICIHIQFDLHLIIDLFAGKRGDCITRNLFFVEFCSVPVGGVFLSGGSGFGWGRCGGWCCCWG